MINFIIQSIKEQLIIHHGRYDGAEPTQIRQ